MAEAKGVVRDVNPKAYKNFYNKLGSKDSKVKIYILVNLRNKKNKDLGVLNALKIMRTRYFMKDKEVRNHWKRYFRSILN